MGQEEEKAQSMPGLSNLRIAKKAYVFDVKRKYAVSRTFAVKKKPETAAEDALDQFRSLFGKRKGQKKEEPKLAGKKPPAQLSAIVKTAIVVVLLFLLGTGLFIALRLGAAAPGPPPPVKTDSFSGSLQHSIAQTLVLSSESSGAMRRSAYFLVDYTSQNLSELNFSATLYSKRPATQAFLLSYERDGDDNYPVFRKFLFEGLGANGMPINDIDIDQLSSMPGGSTLIVPTGYIPKELAGVDSSFSYKTLLARGINIVYIGFEFDRYIERTGLTVPYTQTDLSFARISAESKDGFNLFDSYYTVSPQQSSGLTKGEQIYGSVSVIRGGEGAMLFLAQNLDGGWRGDDRNHPGKVAADDVVRLVVEERWLPSIADVSQAGKVERGQQKLSLFTGEFDADSGFAKLSTVQRDRNGLIRRTVDVSNFKKTQKGEMSPREKVAIPYYLSSQRTRVNIELKEESSSPVKLFVRVYRDGQMVDQEELELGLTNPTTERPKDLQLNVAPGRYVLEVEDTSGKLYAAAPITVAGLEVETAGAQWQTGKFRFLLSSNGQRVAPRQLSVTMDGRGERDYSPSSLTTVDGKAALDYDATGEIAAGQHTFNFTASGQTTSVSLNYTKVRQVWEDPLVVILALMSIGIAGVGALLRRPETVRYGLDIPDFPPMSTIKIPVKREVLLDIFDTVNSGYSWQWMPIRMEEIKNGFRRLTHNGKPILIGDFNLERLLAKLKEEGAVKEELGYFGLSRWEEQSKHSIRYLAMYRIMRNVFVNNAVKFSRLDAMPDCDIKAIADKNEIYLHIMQEPKDAVVHRALATAKLGTTIIVFGTEEERDLFASSLTSTSKLAVGLKMEVNAGNIQLLPVKNSISNFLKTVVR